MPDLDLGLLQRQTIDYFRDYAHPDTGLVADSSRPGAPSSIAAVGFALTVLPVGVERGWIPRAEALARCLAVLRFFTRSASMDAATGHRGFIYHFLSLADGRRVWSCELSTIDTALLTAGMLCAARYFDRDGADERELRERAQLFYQRVEWDWALAVDGSDPTPPLSHGWTPERGFIPWRWTGYSEALILYALALGSPTHPIPAASYRASCNGHEWRTSYGIDHLHAAPLFIHQYSHCWLDLIGIADDPMRLRGSDYAVNTRLATQVQQAYAVENPHRFIGYGRHCWGFTASDGPGHGVRRFAGRRQRFHAYHARGAPDGPDDGTIAPWAVAASLPFAPDLVLPTLAEMTARHPRILGRYGLTSGFNCSVGRGGWFSDRWFGLDQGPVAIMAENHGTGLVWELMRGCPAVVTGLRRMGFAGGWLGAAAQAA